MKEGVKVGEQNANYKNAKVMLAKGYNINDIAEITGLGLEEIKALSSISGDLPTLK